MTNPETEAPWGKIADAACLSLEVHSRESAQNRGYALAPTAEFVAILIPDQGAITAVNFLTAAHLQEFIREMSPRNIKLHVGPGEDHTAISELLLRDLAERVH